MGIDGRKTRLYKKWISLSIKKRNGLFTGIVFLIILLSVIFGFWVVKFSLYDFRVILDDNAKSSDFMDSMEAESSCFETFMKHPNEENRDEMEKSFEQTKKAVLALPFDYNSMGIRRYAKTWSIKNSYDNYTQKRDSVLVMSESNAGYIKELYKVYELQSYLQEYARILMLNTLDDGKAVYVSKVRSIRQLPVAIIITGILLISVMISLSSEMNRTMISPIMKLVNISKKIEANNFFTEDVEVDNQDEMGELVKAFNKMKYATGQYITALEEKRKMLDLLHKEELEIIEAEKNLETANLELLKSQINPHFLFNTLNVIGGMAKLEDADTTERMIKALSTIFRYNLKNQQNEVLLSQEIKVVKDYMYLQQMRFGSRIDFNIKCNLDMATVIVPTFTFQPLVENAIIHGISKKEEGGKIGIYIKMKEQDLIISIVDTGVGMTKEELGDIRGAFKKGQTGKLGIGLGNIYKRVHGMYDKGEIEVFSKKNAGTIVRLVIPQIKWELS
jgi:two-component system, LytTR family, sensor kinase